MKKYYFTMMGLIGFIVLVVIWNLTQGNFLLREPNKALFIVLTGTMIGLVMDYTAPRKNAFFMVGVWPVLLFCSGFISGVFLAGTISHDPEIITRVTYDLMNALLLPLGVGIVFGAFFYFKIKPVQVKVQLPKKKQKIISKSSLKSSPKD